MRTDAMPVVISAAVEGDVDEAVAHKLVRHVGGRLGTVYGKTWRPDVAARHADSLQRAIACLRRLVEGRRDGGQGS